MGKRTAQKDMTIDTTSDSQVNSNFPDRWSPASLTFNNYFYSAGNFTRQGVVGWSEGAGVNFQCRGVLLVWMMVGQGPIALAVDADGGLFGHFSLGYLFFLPLFGRRPDID